MHQDRHLQDPRPVGASLLQDRSYLLDTRCRLILDATGNDRVVDDGHLSTDEDEVTETGAARQRLADATETGDVRVSLGEGAGGGGERGGAGESGQGSEETKVEEHGDRIDERWVKCVLWWMDLWCCFLAGEAVVRQVLAFIPRPHNGHGMTYTASEASRSRGTPSCSEVVPQRIVVPTLPIFGSSRLAIATNPT